MQIILFTLNNESAIAALILFCSYVRLCILSFERKGELFQSLEMNKLNVALFIIFISFMIDLGKNILWHNNHIDHFYGLTIF